MYSEDQWFRSAQRGAPCRGRELGGAAVAITCERERRPTDALGTMRLNSHQVPSNGLRMPLCQAFFMHCLLLCSGLSVAAHIARQAGGRLYPSPKAEGDTIEPVVSNFTPFRGAEASGWFRRGVRLADDEKGLVRRPTSPRKTGKGDVAGNTGALAADGRRTRRAA